MTENGSWRARPFTRIRGNFKVAFDDEISDRTIFVGANQAGKSSRIIGARYATMGVEGWSLGVHGSDIAGELAAPGADLLFCELFGPDGSARFEVVQEGGKWREPDKKPKFTATLEAQLTKLDRERIMPLVSMADLLSLGPDLGRREVMRRFGESARVPDLIKPKPDQKKLWEEVKRDATVALTKKDPATGAVVEPDPSAILVLMNSMFNKRKLAVGKQMKALEEALSGRRGILAHEAAGAEQLPALRAQLERARAWESAAHLRARQEQLELDKARYREISAPLQAQLSAEAKAKRTADEESRRTELTEAVSIARDRVAAINRDLQEQVKKLGWGENLVEALMRAGPCADKVPGMPLHVCPVCRSPFDREQALAAVAPLVEERKASVATARVRLATAEAEVGQTGAALAMWEREVAQAQETLQRAAQPLFQEHARIRAAEDELKRVAASTNVPSSYTGPTAKELQTQIEGLENAERAKKQLEDDTAACRDLKDGRDLAKDLEEESKKILEEYIRRTQSTAEAAVSKYLPDGLRAVLDLDKNAWRTTDRHGAARSRHAMCGFEHNALVPALHAAYTEPSALRILCLDDPDIAGVGLESVDRFFGALEKSIANGWVTQVLVAGNRLEPALPRLADRGWRIVYVDERAQPKLHVVETALADPANLKF